MSREYLDFEVEIRDEGASSYVVTVIKSPAGEARASMTFPFSEFELQNNLLALENALQRSGGQEEEMVKQFGQALFDMLMTGDVRMLYYESQREAAHVDKGLRVKLRIQPPELASLPWEFLYDPRSEYICLSNRTPLVRYPEVSQPPLPLSVTPPLRILGMVASPVGLDELNVSIEKQRVETSLKPLQESGLVELAWLPGQTWRDLQRALRQETWHVLHFIGHGGFEAVRDEGVLMLADDAGKPSPLFANQLGQLLANHPSLRLALLNSCGGARGSNLNVFSSTATMLIYRGLPAVVAMQYEISDSAAIEFVRAFYESVADGMPIDMSVAEARVAMSLAVTNTLAWGAPVLYMRAPNGEIFSTTKISKHIMERFRSETDRGLRRVQTHITGIDSRIERYEIDQIEEQLRQGKQVIATGESGVGKSGIAHVLVENALEEGKSVLYLNCLRVVSISTEADLRRHIDLNGSLIQAIQRLGIHQGCRLVVDQFDNTVGLPISRILTDMLLDCSSCTGVEIVLMSRARETDERRMLEQFTSTVAERFVRLQINELNPEQVTTILDTLAVAPTQALIALGANLLNLELIAKIRATNPYYIWSNITSEVQLWEQYLRVIQERESPDIATGTLNYAIDCARQSLQDEGNLVRLRRDLTAAQRRLISWGVLVHIEGRVYQFKHEQLRDYLYAWDATEDGKMPDDVVAELIPYKTRNVLLWMGKIYSRNDSRFSAEFARKVFNV